jgi:hypothetical protein
MMPQLSEIHSPLSRSAESIRPPSQSLVICVGAVAQLAECVSSWVLCRISQSAETVHQSLVICVGGLAQLAHACVACWVQSVPLSQPAESVMS